MIHQLIRNSSENSIGTFAQKGFPLFTFLPNLFNVGYHLGDGEEFETQKNDSIILCYNSNANTC